jgi:protein-tyrosine phosphatase
MQAELYWIEGPWPGRLAIMPRPRGGDWLEEEAASWRRMGIDVVASTLTKEETRELDLTREEEVCKAAKIAFVAFPFPDRSTPPSQEATLGLVSRLEQELASGKNVAIHCRQGIGRSALLAACVLAMGGVELELAWERIAAARGCSIPDTDEQWEWVARFVRELLIPLPHVNTLNEETAKEFDARERQVKRGSL